MKKLPAPAYPILLFALASLLYFTRLSGTDLKEPNEPIAAQAAREMMHRGDWIVPTVNGEPYPDKPPMLFWGIWLASLPSGEVDEVSARLPSALSALLLVLGVYFFSRPVLGDRGAFLGAGTLAVSNLFVEQARYVQHDMLLCLGTVVATLALFRLKDGEAHAAAWVAIAASALALGILDKGPIGLALPAMILAAEGVAQRTLFRRLGLLTLAGALGLVAPLGYYALLARSNGLAMVQTFLYRHNMDRFVAGFDHQQPWWFFLARSPADFLPGTLLLPAALLARVEDPVRRRFHLRGWIGILVPLIFFSFSSSKRPVYMLPALPFVALLGGSLIDLLARELSGGPAKRLAVVGEAGALALLGVAGIATPFLANRQAPDLVIPCLLLGILAFAGAAAGMGQLVRRRWVATHGWLIASLAAIWLVVVGWALPAANRINSPRYFAEEIARRVPPQAPLRSYGLYRFRSGYVFYAHRLMPRLADRPALAAYLQGRERVFCIVPTRDLASLRSELPDPIHVIATGKAGHREEVLISNLPPDGTSPADQEFPDTAPESPPPGAGR